MEEIKLIAPSMEYGEDVMQFRREMIETEDKDSFAGCNGLRKCQNINEWLDYLAMMEHDDTCPKGMVTSTTYLAVRTSDNKVVGIIDLRHHINHPVLGLWAGHMGYTVRRDERNKGYAKEMVRLNLENCRKRNMDRVMITCSRGNIASEKVILANGGVFEREVLVEGEWIKRYWIEVELKCKG